MSTDAPARHAPAPHTPAPGAPRLLAATGPGLDQHLAAHGPPPTGWSPDALVAEVAASGLTGRGGAHRRTGERLAAVRDAAAATARAAVVVANASEGEPGSRKDVHLLASAPHLVLDGLQLAAVAVGADRAVLVAHPGPGLSGVEAALEERRRARWPLDRLPVRVVRAAPGFVAGQESAVVAHVDGAPAVPRGSGVPVARSGVDGRPTLVQNVETLAHLALVARRGAAWFAAAGTPEDPGTALFTTTAPGGVPRVVEVALGSPLTAVVGDPAAAQAVLLGGYHGGWVRGEDLAGAVLTAAGTAAVGGRLGAGVVQVLPHGTCGLRATAQVTGYLAGQSARQCGPCTLGLPHLAALVAALADGAPVDLDGLRRVVGLLEGRGACRHPDASAAMVASALVAFEADVRAHQDGRCLHRPDEVLAGHRPAGGPVGRRGRVAA